MAEFLDPRDGYKLVTLPDWQAPQPWWIEVPEGADSLLYSTINNNLYHFVNNGTNELMSVQDINEGKGVWYGIADNYIWSVSPTIIWQRATQPEELPFIDDEPPAHFVVRPKPRERVYAVIGEWSPDWSQAPEWAGWWCAIMKDGIITGGWWNTHKPETICPIGNYSCYSHHGRCEQAPSFGYSGDWKDSVTKRPKSVSA